MKTIDLNTWEDIRGEWVLLDEKEMEETLTRLLEMLCTHDQREHAQSELIRLGGVPSFSERVIQAVKGVLDKMRGVLNKDGYQVIPYILRQIYPKWGEEEPGDLA